MNEIKLTEEQKNKLLEMCKVLFPLDYFSFNNDYGDDGIIDRNFASNYIPKSMKHLSWNDEGSHFHWFEFCVLYLFPKLNQWYNSQQLTDFLYQTIGNSKNIEPNEVNKFPHPVDYLYNKFKKL